MNVKQLIVREQAYFLKEHTHARAYRYIVIQNPPGLSALLHLYQNIRQKMLGLVDLYFELILSCFIEPSYNKQLCIDHLQHLCFQKKYPTQTSQVSHRLSKKMDANV